MTELIDANTQAAPATVDAAAFAEAMADKLAARLQPSTPPAVVEDEIRTLVQQLKGAGVEDGEIQAHISTALGIDTRVDRKLKATKDEAIASFNQTLQRKEINSVFSRVLRSYSKDDELVTEASGSIREKGLSEFFNGTSTPIVTARSRFFSTGDMDEDVVEDIVARHVKRLHQAADSRTGKKSNATPSLKGSDTSARPPATSDTDNITLDDLTPRQEEVYNGHLRVMRYDQSRPLEEAKKLALAAAIRFKK